MDGGREKERERGRERGEIEKTRDRESCRARQRDRQREREKGRKREREREREREGVWEELHSFRIMPKQKHPSSYALMHNVHSGGFGFLHLCLLRDR